MFPSFSREQLIIHFEFFQLLHLEKGVEAVKFLQKLRFIDDPLSVILANHGASVHCVGFLQMLLFLVDENRCPLRPSERRYVLFATKLKAVLLVESEELLLKAVDICYEFLMLGYLRIDEVLEGSKLNLVGLVF